MPKKWRLGQFTDLWRVGLREKEGVGIFEGWLIPQCTLWFSVNDSEFEKSKCLNMSL